MPRFAYVAQDARDVKVSGAMGASSRREALNTLINRKLTPVWLREEKPSRFHQRSVKTSDIESTFEMLSDLLSSGMSLSKALDVLCRRITSPKMRSVLERVRDEVVDGTSLAAALAEHPEVFRPITISLVDAAEQGGFLEESLEQLAESFRREQELRGQVLAALAYPVFLMVVGTMVMFGMMVFFVPRFEPLFGRMSANGELPFATSALLAASDFLRGHLVLLLGLVGLAGFMGLVLSDQSSRKTWLNSIRMRLPLVGPVFVELAIARLARTLGTMLSGGVPIVQALEISRHSVGDPRLELAVLNSSKNVQEGRSLTEPLRECNAFPIELTEMIAVGEQSNRLEKVLLAMAEKLESRSKRRLDSLVKLIEPMMMVVMACLVGFLITALLLPVFSSAGRFY